MIKFLGAVLLLAGFQIPNFSHDKSPVQEKSSQAFVCLADSDEHFYQGFESFLRNLFTSEFGYTLVGAKPISIEELPREGMYEVRDEYITALKDLFEKSPTFVLKVIDRGPLLYPYIELINTRKLRTIIRQNPVVNKFVKKKFLTEGNFFSQLLSPQQSIFQVIRDEEIIGYILGYSESNIKYYLRRIEVGCYLQKYPLYRFHPLPGSQYSETPIMHWNVSPYYEHSNPSKGFKSLENEWQWINDIVWDLTKESTPLPPYFVSLPIYICRYGRDSERARERFKLANCKIAELFYKKSFQEAISEKAHKPYHEPSLTTK